MTRRVIRLERAAQHPGVAVLFDALTNERLDQVAASRIDMLLGKRKCAYYSAAYAEDHWKLYEEVSPEAVEAMK